MKKKNAKKNKKVNIGLIIVISIIIVILLAVGIYFYDYYKRLDGRECMTCPYVYDLTVNDVEILDKSVRGYNATVEVGTSADALKIDGKVYLKYKCDINYCFSSSFSYLCSWNYTSNGTIIYEFDEGTSESKTFSVKPYNEPTSIYMYMNSIKCNFTIDDVSGKFKIYGEKVR